MSIHLKPLYFERRHEIGKNCRICHTSLLSYSLTENKDESFLGANFCEKCDRSLSNFDISLIKGLSKLGFEEIPSPWELVNFLFPDIKFDHPDKWIFNHAFLKLPQDLTELVFKLLHHTNEYHYYVSPSFWTEITIMQQIYELCEHIDPDNVIIPLNLWSLDLHLFHANEIKCFKRFFELKDDFVAFNILLEIERIFHHSHEVPLNDHPLIDYKELIIPDYRDLDNLAFSDSSFVVNQLLIWHKNYMQGLCTRRSVLNIFDRISIYNYCNIYEELKLSYYIQERVFILMMLGKLVDQGFSMLEALSAFKLDFVFIEEDHKLCQKDFLLLLKCIGVSAMITLEIDVVYETFDLLSFELAHFSYYEMVKIKEHFKQLPLQGLCYYDHETALTYVTLCKDVLIFEDSCSIELAFLLFANSHIIPHKNLGKIFSIVFSKILEYLNCQYYSLTAIRDYFEYFLAENPLIRLCTSLAFDKFSFVEEILHTESLASLHLHYLRDFFEINIPWPGFEIKISPPIFGAFVLSYPKARNHKIEDLHCLIELGWSLNRAINVEYFRNTSLIYSEITSLSNFIMYGSDFQTKAEDLYEQSLVQKQNDEFEIEIKKEPIFEEPLNESLAGIGFDSFEEEVLES
eukprot:TRINITY_DN2732_c0_g1_i1.p1 TRINITY_DN2732_c0_g1~~TRINITY_DN2732_c0_g1_i1.p1  ORF type:complete len:630 (+),score=132.51 TRINITY_DN2732_c0_g1_i1:428-2317(+)